MPWFFLAAVALLSLFWGYVFFRRCGLLGGCFAALIAGSCFGHPFYHFSAITIDRCLLVLIAGLYFAHRCLHDLPAKRPNRADVGLLVFLIGLCLSTFTHHWRVDDAQPLATLLFFYLMPFILYWVASRSSFGEPDFLWLMLGFCCFGVYLSFTALCEVSGLTATVFPRYIASLEHAEFFGRARGPYLNPVGNGFYMTVCFIATLLLWPHVRRAHRPLVLAVALLILAGQICTMTRSVWLGLAFSIVALGVVNVPHRHRLRVVLAMSVLGVMALGATGSRLMRFKRDKDVSAAQMAESAKLRPILAAYALEVFRDEPLSGIGFGQYRHRNVDYLTTRTFDVPMDKGKSYIQHNVFLSLLSETGLLGLLSFVLVIFFWGADGWTTWFAQNLELWQRQIGLLALMILAAYVPNAMFHELSLIPMLNALVFFVFGLLRSQQESKQDACSMPAVVKPIVAGRRHSFSRAVS